MWQQKTLKLTPQQHLQLVFIASLFGLFEWLIKWPRPVDYLIYQRCTYFDRSVQNLELSGDLGTLKYKTNEYIKPFLGC